MICTCSKWANRIKIKTKLKSQEKIQKHNTNNGNPQKQQTNVQYRQLKPRNISGNRKRDRRSIHMAISCGVMVVNVALSPVLLLEESLLLSSMLITWPVLLGLLVIETVSADWVVIIGRFCRTKKKYTNIRISLALITCYYFAHTCTVKQLLNPGLTLPLFKSLSVLDTILSKLEHDLVRD